VRDNECIQNIGGEKVGRLRKCEENSITDLTETCCVDVRWTEIAQACLKVDFSISNVKPSGYVAGSLNCILPHNHDMKIQDLESKDKMQHKSSFYYDTR